MVKSKDLKQLGVPLYEGLSVSDVLNWADKFPDVARALPMEQREIDKLLRQYVINIVYTVAGDDFRQWVEQVMDERNAKIKEERDLGIDLDPEILRIFKASTSVSSKCLFFSFNLLRCSVNRESQPPDEVLGQAPTEQGPDKGGEGRGREAQARDPGEAAGVAGTGEAAGERPSQSRVGRKHQQRLRGHAGFWRFGAAAQRHIHRLR